MLLRSLLPLILSASAAVALDPRIERLRGPKFHLSDDAPTPQQKRSHAPAPNAASKFYTPSFSNSAAADFHVNSSALPLVTWQLQDSWAGRLPISNESSESRELFFWYWPSSESGSSEFLTIWLNGGPGCSSLEGFLEENGPVSFQPGASAPVQNQYSWTTVSDVVWIEQPVGTGFTKGTPNIHNEDELADQFYGFLQQFFSVFSELATKKLYITGESYAGFYIPYIATRILDASAAEKAALPLALQGLLINDGVYSSFITSEQVPVANFSAARQSTLGFSSSQVQSLQRKAESCGYQTIIDQLAYPPKGKIDLPNGNQDVVSDGCDLFDTFYDEAYDANSCFDIYRITDKCPTPNDPIEDYFSRSDVQTLLHVPGFGSWSECSNENVFVDGNDESAYTETLFPHLLATLPHGVTLWHGLDDAILFNLGDRITIQNLTWNGAQGFQTAPTTPLLLNGAQKGIYHSERNLTYIEVNSAGHMIAEDQPPLALHVFQSVLGLTTL
ncbi:alpha/beta-hydrolase [Neolentinus lepideus HHB14362 ss-1]|uniref:Carboxypeptidase n=1 Tax=Neolentinus lepideus HHB14362 ss-1 TaxID=1314782 RepID=A0A165W340_9AGAM|nr:alpha/beta-hydrolase [Neolentinus lepideus HHB14362 ss-1]